MKTQRTCPILLKLQGVPILPYHSSFWSGSAIIYTVLFYYYTVTRFLLDCVYSIHVYELYVTGRHWQV